MRRSLKSGAGMAAAALAAVTGASLGMMPAAAQKKAVRVRGSELMIALGKAWETAFSQANPGLHVEVRGGGSTVGLASLARGEVDVAASSREATSAEKAAAKEKGSTLVGTTCAWDALSVAVHPGNPITQISVPELASIYVGGQDVEFWSQVGGGSGRISVFTRSNDSGTFGFIEETVLKGKSVRKDAIRVISTTKMAEELRKQPAGLGFGGGSSFRGHRELKVLGVSSKINGRAVLPTPEAIRGGSYPLRRPLFLYTLGRPQGPVAKFLQFCTGPAGQKVATGQGFVSLK